MWHPDSLLMAITSVVIFGLLGVVLTILGYKVFDLITPRIDVQTELAEKHNVAVAIVVAAVIIGVAMVVSAALSS